jgi:hypothetical protein
MSDSPIIDWSTIVHKDVRSDDGADLGIVDAVDDDYIILALLAHVESTSCQNQILSLRITPSRNLKIENRGDAKVRRALN